ncbi:trimeric intracellular cation channel family protein [Corynebacterium yonathiae]|uniref:Trimeric intracellular cation channel family protein n=1 Tax=Corynebacterium yonathiae TaxID=2913504 RepID=A0A9X3LYX2_9CORY|nr:MULTISPECIES: trimeric intracellular cation channel family protein [Corynebacterium]MCZ9296544.1 trimeric intracellular cation channel family protein [Corynebacterium yonathiae]MDK2583421.1 trimeric intracellular cation channel family protein [Corynebacterium sp. BWA136]
MHDVDPLINSLYQAFDLLGVILNGIIGGTIARRREFDIVGFVFLALFSGLAGGMIRDMLIGDGAAAAISDPWYLGLACGGALIAFLIDLKGKAWELFREHGDAVILGVWSTTGCVKALTHGMPLIPCVFLGVLTAVGGGMVRDVASGEIPSIFGGSPLYAVPSILTGVVMVTFAHNGQFALGMIISPIVGSGMAILSYWRGWVLPRAGVAPVNYTAAQVAAIAKKAELKGFRRGRKKN